MRDSYEDSPAEARDLGLRRLSRLTWRTAQLGALATVGFAIVFARGASAPAANVQTVPPGSPAATVPVPAAGPASAKPQGLASTKPAPPTSTRPGSQRTAQVTPATARPASAPAPSPTVSHTLAPPATTPAPAPKTSSPAPTATSTSHGGG